MPEDALDALDAHDHPTLEACVIDGHGTGPHQVGGVTWNFEADSAGPP